MLKLTLLMATASMLLVPRGDGDETIPPCGHCAPTPPEITKPAGGQAGHLVLVLDGLQKQKGDCIEEHTGALCDQQRRGCEFWGEIVLRETNAASNANPTPADDPNAVPPVRGWIQTSANPGARKWKFVYGASGGVTSVNCNSEDTLGLQVQHTLPDGTTVTDAVKVKCGKCPDA